MGIPEACPNCGKILYRVAHLRPAPSFSYPAYCVLALGCLVSGLVCWALLEAVPGGARISFRGLGILMVLVALVVMLAFGMVAYQFPKVMKLHCYRCGWRQRIVMKRQPSRPVDETTEDPAG